MSTQIFWLIQDGAESTDKSVEMEMTASTEMSVCLSLFVYWGGGGGAAGEGSRISNCTGLRNVSLCCVVSTFNRMPS